MDLNPKPICGRADKSPGVRDTIHATQQFAKQAPEEQLFYQCHNQLDWGPVHNVTFSPLCAGFRAVGRQLHPLFNSSGRLRKDNKNAANSMKRVSRLSKMTVWVQMRFVAAALLIFTTALVSAGMFYCRGKSVTAVTPSDQLKSARLTEVAKLSNEPVWPYKCRTS